MKYAFRRMLHCLVTLFAVSLISFVLADLAPGDYYSELRLDPRVSSGTVASLRAQAGLDEALPVRYAHWLSSLAHGDFGYSLAYGGAVAPLLWPRVLATLLLTGVATAAAWLLALPAGIWTASHRGTWRDSASYVGFSFLLSVPDLLLAILALVLAVQSGFFPVGGMTSPEFASMTAPQRIWDVAKRVALPVGVLAVGLTPVLARHVRASMIEAMNAPFAVAARAQGIPKRRLLLFHIFPAALNPLISLFGFSLGTLLSGSLLVEVVMGWPGLGPFFLEAVMARDFAVVLAVIMLSAAFLASGNLIADLLLYRFDPRIRAK